MVDAWLGHDEVIDNHIKCRKGSDGKVYRTNCQGALFYQQDGATKRELNDSVKELDEKAIVSGGVLYLGSGKLVSRKLQATGARLCKYKLSSLRHQSFVGMMSFNSCCCFAIFKLSNNHRSDIKGRRSPQRF